MHEFEDLPKETQATLMLLGEGWVYQWSYNTFLKRGRGVGPDVAIDAATMKELTEEEYYKLRLEVDSGTEGKTAIDKFAEELLVTDAVIFDTLRKLGD
ncbi:hypothetical protein EVB41_060 [Rhizobium phage RHph_TM3_14A]|nr:hypothetical protein EVB29_060 [Rhizobium phage RHph_TM27A]QIG66980.1 hypothetical protein EVB30_060 [Rhizobium phage RHph_TM27B]QIG67069.1 hypothetical protein EVB31_059 [Rhizobium phage RHph_TM29]QIG67525.1 hypothetical protein EVB41_060 [Rhizobium phage RHph_TM3_14A]